jgi:hypothetical protein
LFSIVLFSFVFNREQVVANGPDGSPTSKRGKMELDWTGLVHSCQHMYVPGSRRGSFTLGARISVCLFTQIRDSLSTDVVIERFVSSHPTSHIPHHTQQGTRAATKKTNMGVEKEIIKAGDEENYPQAGDMLSMHYTGTLASDGSQFDSSVSRGKPFQFVIGIGQVIRGWDEGVMKMSLGEKAMLRISSDFAYGSRGAPGAIPPNADLHFEVELLAIGEKKAPGFSDSPWWCNIL